MPQNMSLEPRDKALFICTVPLILAAALAVATPTWAQTSAPPSGETPGYPSTGPLSGYMDFHFNKDAIRTARSTSTDSCCS